MNHLLLLGSTGAVGQHVLRQALDNSLIAHVIGPTRRPLPAHIKLENPVVDFNNFADDASWLKADAVICALGTTIKIAGSQDAFAAVDRDLPIRIAGLSRKAGAASFALNSALGASPDGNFYQRTKYEAEAGIRAVGYPRFTIVLPSLIDTDRSESRPAEYLGLLFARIFRPLIPYRYRAVKAESIAQALLAGVLQDNPGEYIIESDKLHAGILVT